MAVKQMSKKRKRKRKKSKPDACSRCDRDSEAFYCYKKNFIFDVDMARAYTSDGREPVELYPVDVEWAISRCQINDDHVPHVDPSIPGIVAHMFFLDEDGSYAHGHRVIDGHHRAVRCTQLGQPFRAYILTESESIAILTKAPSDAKPSYIPAAPLPEGFER